MSSASGATSPTNESEASELSRASTFDELDCFSSDGSISDGEAAAEPAGAEMSSSSAGNHASSEGSRSAMEHPHLALMIESLRSELPPDVSQTIEAVIDKILNRRVHITKPQFHAWLGLVAKDELRALRRACEIGRARLEAQGLRRPRPPSSSPQQVTDAAAGTHAAAHAAIKRFAFPSPPRPQQQKQQQQQQGREAVSDGRLSPDSAGAIARRILRLPISSHGRVITKGLHVAKGSALAKVRAQVMLEPPNLIIDECESRVAHLRL